MKFSINSSKGKLPDCSPKVAQLISESEPQMRSQCHVPWLFDHMTVPQHYLHHYLHGLGNKPGRTDSGSLFSFIIPLSANLCKNYEQEIMKPECTQQSSSANLKGAGVSLHFLFLHFPVCCIAFILSFDHCPFSGRHPLSFPPSLSPFLGFDQYQAVFLISALIHRLTSQRLLQ